MRTFISIELPEDIKNGIVKLISELKKNLTPVKWVENKNLHITLKFLGQVYDNKIDRLKIDTKELVRGYKKFSVGIKGLGMFPEGKSPQVIWVGIDEGSDKVKDLGDILDKGLADKGYREEEGEFNPHLTIGRIKERIDTGELIKHIGALNDRLIGKFEVPHVSLVKSTLTQSGPVYEVLENITL